MSSFRAKSCYHIISFGKLIHPKSETFFVLILLCLIMPTQSRSIWKISHDALLKYEIRILQIRDPITMQCVLYGAKCVNCNNIYMIPFRSHSSQFLLRSRVPPHARRQHVAALCAAARVTLQQIPCSIFPCVILLAAWLAQTDFCDWRMTRK